MSFKNVSTGGGLVAVGLGLATIAGAMVVSGSGGAAHAGGLRLGAMVASAAMSQAGGGPTVVWYGVTSPVVAGNTVIRALLVRAWSDGTVEAKHMILAGADCNFSVCPNWIPVANPNDGLAAFGDLNGDEMVDALDLSEVLSRWGDAPRNDIPPSNCPLDLINP